jgi:diguanylate cyclase (GGDEF)-like protein/PAS domain S-box-containing protein
MNPAAESLTGWDSQDAIGQNWSGVLNLLEEQTRKAIKEIADESPIIDTSNILLHNSIIVSKDGTETPVYYNASPIVDDQGKNSGTVLLLRDITAQKQIEYQLRQSAFYDSLTGLPNRELFKEHLLHSANVISRQPDYLFSVLFIDLDGFKLVNDNYGHAAGDEVLVSAANRLKALIRPLDTISRFGGDEFVILLDDLREFEDAKIVAQRIIDNLQNPFPLKSAKVSLSASIGIVSSNEYCNGNGHPKIDQLIQDADFAMYYAKTNGKGRYKVFDSTLRNT